MSLPKWFDSENVLRRQNRRSGAQERRRAADLGGRTQAGSGASWRAPQDVVSPEYLESLKFTDRQSFTVKLHDWLDVRRDADRAGKEPRMVIDFMVGSVRLVITEEPWPSQ